jgi:hypothetical protein
LQDAGRAGEFTSKKPQWRAGWRNKCRPYVLIILEHSANPSASRERFNEQEKSNEKRTDRNSAEHDSVRSVGAGRKFDRPMAMHTELSGASWKLWLHDAEWLGPQRRQ